MKNVFFGEHGDKIDASNKQELIKKLKGVDTKVLDKIKGRTHDHIERSDFVSYVQTIAYNNLLKYPLSIEKSESPDFLISSKGKIIGLEVCAATNEDIEKLKIELEKEVEITKKNVTVHRGGNRPIYGNEVEHIFAELVSKRILEKTIKLDKYQKADRHELLIYYDGVISNLLAVDNIAVAITLLKAKLDGEIDYKNTYDNVSIIISMCLIYDCLNECELYVLYKFRNFIYIS